MKETPYLVGGYDESSGKDYSAASLCLITPKCRYVLLSAYGNIPPGWRGSISAVECFCYILARSCAPRVAHLALFGKTARIRKKNRRRLRKEIAKSIKPPPRVRPLVRPGAHDGLRTSHVIFDEMTDFIREGREHE